MGVTAARTPAKAATSTSKNDDGGGRGDINHLCRASDETTGKQDVAQQQRGKLPEEEEEVEEE